MIYLLKEKEKPSPPKYGMAIIRQKDDKVLHGEGLQREITSEVHIRSMSKYMLVFVI
jgi:hypothetical protein